MRFEWDEGKRLANQRKHGVSFEEAQQLFSSGSDFLEIYDEAHSDLEERFIGIGPIRRGIVVVVWTEPEDETVRIIGARLATRRERDLFHRFVDEHG